MLVQCPKPMPTTSFIGHNDAASACFLAAHLLSELSFLPERLADASPNASAHTQRNPQLRHKHSLLHLT